MAGGSVLAFKRRQPLDLVRQCPNLRNSAEQARRLRELVRVEAPVRPQHDPAGVREQQREHRMPVPASLQVFGLRPGVRIQQVEDIDRRLRGGQQSQHGGGLGAHQGCATVHRVTGRRQPRQTMRGLVDAQYGRLDVVFGQQQRAVAMTATEIHDQRPGNINTLVPTRKLRLGRGVQRRPPDVVAMALHDLFEARVRRVLPADDLG